VYVGDLAPPLLPLLHAPHLRTTQLRVTRVPQITSHEQRLAQIHAINYCCLLVQAAQLRCAHVAVLHVHSDSHAGTALRRSQLLDQKGGRGAVSLVMLTGELGVGRRIGHGSLVKRIDYLYVLLASVVYLRLV
jgi:hypothetical protein